MVAQCLQCGQDLTANTCPVCGERVIETFEYNPTWRDIVSWRFIRVFQEDAVSVVWPLGVAAALLSAAASLMLFPTMHHTAGGTPVPSPLMGAVGLFMVLALLMHSTKSAMVFRSMLLKHKLVVTEKSVMLRRGTHLHVAGVTRVLGEAGILSIGEARAPASWFTAAIPLILRQRADQADVAARHAVEWEAAQWRRPQ